MYCAYQDRKELEDDLYQDDEGDSDGSEANSELEFHLYSQLHYSSNARALEEQEDGGETAEGQDSLQPEGPEKTVDVDGEREHTGDSRPPSPDLSKLLQYLEKKEKKKREKLDNQKTGNPKSQRSSSSFIEEVIVIDSSPDVISISEDDTDDDDEGVCNLKGRSLRRLRTSTPAQQGSKKRSVSAPVTVDSSTSASDSEESESESSDSSDSDHLESWMILGRGKQDEDQSISLNLEGGADGNEDYEEGESGWLVSARDKEARIYNRDKGVRMTAQRMSNRYYTNKNVQCRNCKKNGHLSKNCPESKKLAPCFLCGNPGHMAVGCPNKHCNNCGLPGHLFDSCNEKRFWHKRCERCGMTGHYYDACPEIWRQYHLTTKAGLPSRQRREDRGRTQQVYCYNCSRRGHFGHACKLQRMYNRTYPSTPFINLYDTKKDIRSREKWIKVKELKKSSCVLASSQSPLTPGPPKKKQKVGYHNSYDQPNHTPRQSTHKPNHLFFKDSDVFEAAAPKTKKNNKHKQQESNVKTWKPKRPVPTSKDPLPAAKVFVDEAEDFPRGGGKVKGIQKLRKKAKNRKHAPSAPSEVHREGRPDRLRWTVTGEMQGSASKQQKGKKNKKNRQKANRADAPPTDENLFIIKQRKQRKHSR
ncbi:hypothetical protein VZT92_002625 [Zoarces viviparus]|uniref:Zinc finger CCHC domain-containing protein 7 n=1 Tax=Zoarces viviparus TaxID=48416 RepID=A0AAW1FZC0_ZOAVI